MDVLKNLPRTHLWLGRLLVGIVILILLAVVWRWRVQYSAPNFPDTGFTSSDSLFTGLMSYWNLDETSGTRADSLGINDLTDNNSVGFTAGKIGNAADFGGMSSLSHADASAFRISGTTGTTFALWFKSSTPAELSSTIFSKATTETDAEYALYPYGYSGGEFHLEFDAIGGTGDYDDYAFSTLTGAGTIPTGVWHFAVLWYDPADKCTYMEIDGVLQTQVAPCSPLDGSVYNGAGTFGIGQFVATSHTHFEGQVDEFGIWNRVLTAGERTELYNGGAGLTFTPATPTPAPAGGATPTGQLTVNLVIVGGPLTASDVTLFLDGSQMDASTVYTRSTGTHVISQTAATNYSTTFGGDCDFQGNITVTSGGTVTCAVTDTYTGSAGSPIPSPSPASPTRPSTYGLHEGDTISATNSADPDIYIVNDWGYKRLFLNPIIFSFYGHLGGLANVQTISASVRDAFVTSGLFRNCQTNDQKVYAVQITGGDTGILHWLNISGDQAVSQDPDLFHKVFCINSHEFDWYPKGNEYMSTGQIPVYAR